MHCTVLLTLAFLVASTLAKRIVVTVGGNGSDPESVFNPATVTADVGDVVFFNFTEGNHTATQSTFASPCIPAHVTNSTINSFDSSFRDTANGTAITNLPVTVTSNDTIWFFDFNTCAQGGVGGININDSTLETLDGFRRNAIRLNGTDSSDSDNSSSSSSSPSSSSTSPGSSPSTTNQSAANRAVVTGLSGVVPALAALLFISF